MLHRKFHGVISKIWREDVKKITRRSHKKGIAYGLVKNVTQKKLGGELF